MRLKMRVVNWILWLLSQWALLQPVGGQSATPSPSQSPLPLLLPSNCTAAPPSALALSPFHTCMVTGTGDPDNDGVSPLSTNFSARPYATGPGRLICWGAHLGSSATNPSLVPADYASWPMHAVAAGGTGVASANGRSQLTCALSTDGRIGCWSYSAVVDMSTAVPASIQGVVTGVAVGGDFACATLLNGSATCFGNSATVTGNALSGVPLLLPPSADDRAAGIRVEAVAAGVSHVCALLSTGAVACYGTSTATVTGGPADVPSSLRNAFPTGLAGNGISRAIHISAGPSSSCASFVNGSATCWGSITLDGSSTVPSPLQGSILRVATGVGYGCVLTNRGTISCWTVSNSSVTPAAYPPSKLTTGEVWVGSLYAGPNHACAVAYYSGDVYCWGSNAYGQALVPGSVSVTSLALGTTSAGFTLAEETTCFLTSGIPAQTSGNGSYFATGGGSAPIGGGGSSRYGFVTCLGPKEAAQIPPLFYTMQLRGQWNASGVSTSNHATCVVNGSSYGMVCWGSATAASYQQLVIPEGLIPHSNGGITSGLTSVAVGASHTCVLTGAGDVSCFGVSASSNYADYTAVVSGNGYFCGINTAMSSGQPNGVAVCNTIGSGVDSTAGGPVTSSILAANATNTTAVAGGYAHACSLRGNKRVVCWGYDGGQGRLSVPGQFQGRYSAVAAGFAHSCAAMASGGAVCWGLSASGQTAVPAAFDPAISGSAAVRLRSIAAGVRRTCAVDENGCLSCWGGLQLSCDAAPAKISSLALVPGVCTFAPRLPTTTPSLSVSPPASATPSVTRTTSGSGTSTSSGNATTSASATSSVGSSASGSATATPTASSSTTVGSSRSVTTSSTGTATVSRTSTPTSSGTASATLTASSTPSASLRPRQLCSLDDLRYLLAGSDSVDALFSMGFVSAGIASCTGPTSGQTVVAGSACSVRCPTIEQVFGTTVASSNSRDIVTGVVNWGPLAYQCVGNASAPPSAEGSWQPLPWRAYQAMQQAWVEGRCPGGGCVSAAGGLFTATASPIGANHTLCLPLQVSLSSPAAESLPSPQLDVCGDYARLQWPQPRLGQQSIDALVGSGVVGSVNAASPPSFSNAAAVASSLRPWASASGPGAAYFPEAQSQWQQMQTALLQPFSLYRVDALLTLPDGLSPADHPACSIVAQINGTAGAPAVLAVTSAVYSSEGGVPEAVFRLSSVYRHVAAGSGLSSTDSGILSLPAAAGLNCDLTTMGLWLVVAPIVRNDSSSSNNSIAGGTLPVNYSNISSFAPSFAGILQLSQQTPIDTSNSTDISSYLVLNRTAISGDSGSSSKRGYCNIIDVQLNSTLGGYAPVVPDASAAAPVMVLSDALPSLTLRPVLPVPVAPGESLTMRCNSSDARLVDVAPSIILVGGSADASVSLVPQFQRDNSKADSLIPLSITCTVSSSTTRDGVFPSYSPVVTRSVGVLFGLAKWPIIGNAIVHYERRGRTLVLPVPTPVPAPVAASTRRLLMAAEHTERSLQSTSNSASTAAAPTYSSTGTGTSFEILTSQAINVTLLGDTSHWLTSGPHFDASTRVWVGEVACPIVSIGDDGSWLTFTAPPYNVSCGGTRPDDECEPLPLTVSNRLAFASTGLSSLSGAPAAPLSVSVSCPPFCPDGRISTPRADRPTPQPVYLGLVLSNGTPAGGTGTSSSSVEPRLLIVPSSGSSSADVVTSTETLVSSSTAVSSGAAPNSNGVGVHYITACVGYTNPLDGKCTNASDPESYYCAFGLGDSCRLCPEGALCPGGYRAWPRPGYYALSERSGDVTRCSPPAGERCLRWDPVRSLTVCGDVYRAGSIGCESCASGAYPTLDGSCAWCPSVGDPRPIVLAVFLLILTLAGTALVVTGLAYYIIRMLGGGTISGALSRATDLMAWLFAVVQIQVTVGKAASPGLPPYLQRFYSLLSVFAFESLGVHPACLGPEGPFQNNLALYSVVLSFLVLQLLLHVNFRRWLGCDVCGMGRKKAAMLLPPPDQRLSLRMTARQRAALAAATGMQAAAAVVREGAQSSASNIDDEASDDSFAPARQPVRSTIAYANPLSHKHAASGVNDAKNDSQRSGTQPSSSSANRHTSSGSGSNGMRSMLQPFRSASTVLARTTSKRFAMRKAARLTARDAAIAALPLQQRIGAKLDLWKPSLRKALFILLTLLYPTVTAHLLSTLHCVDTDVTAAVYRTMDCDGSALTSRGIPVTPPALQLTATTSIRDYLRGDTTASRIITVPVLASDPYVVCREGRHTGIYAYSLLMLIFYVIGYPVASLWYITRRIWRVTGEQGSWNGVSAAGALSSAKRISGRAGAAVIEALRSFSSQSATGHGSSASTASSATPAHFSAATDARQKSVPAPSLATAVLSDRHRQWAYVMDARSWLLRLWRALAVILCCAGQRHVHESHREQSGGKQQTRLKKQSEGAAALYGSSSQLANAKSADQHATPLKWTAKLRAASSRLLFRNNPISSQQHPGQVGSATAAAIATHSVPPPNGLKHAGLDDTEIAPVKVIGHKAHPAAVVTADDIIDSCGALTSDASLTHFTGSDYRPSAYWFRHLDLLVLFSLTAIVELWPQPRNVGSSVAKSLLVWAVIMVASGYFLVQTPFKASDRWKWYAKMYHLGLLMIITALNLSSILINVAYPYQPKALSVSDNESSGANTVTDVCEAREQGLITDDQLQLMASGGVLGNSTALGVMRSSSGDVGLSLSVLCSGRAAMAMVTFVLSLLFFLILLTGFVWSLYDGIEAEVAEDMAAALADSQLTQQGGSMHKQQQSRVGQLQLPSVDEAAVTPSSPDSPPSASSSRSSSPSSSSRVMALLRRASSREFWLGGPSTDVSTHASGGGAANATADLGAASRARRLVGGTATGSSWRGLGVFGATAVRAAHVHNPPHFEPPSKAVQHHPPAKAQPSEGTTKALALREPPRPPPRPLVDVPVMVPASSILAAAVGRRANAHGVLSSHNPSAPSAPAVERGEDAYVSEGDEGGSFSYSR